VVGDLDNLPYLESLMEEGALVAPHLSHIKDILEADVHEDEMATMLREYMRENVTSIEEASAVSDMLQATKVISKYFFRRLYEWHGAHG
jgi:predicted transcriptional regulator